MKRKLENIIFAAAFMLVACIFLFFTLDIWMLHSPSIRSLIVAMSVAIIMAFCFFVWPVWLALGKSVFANQWVKAAHKSMWSTKSIGNIYFRHNWWRFILHAMIAGIIIFLCYLLGDIIVYGTFHTVVGRLVLSAKLSMLFLVSVAITMIVRYMNYIKERYNIPLSKHV